MKIIKKQLHNKKQLDNNELLVSNERETFKNIFNERLDQIDELSKKDYYGSLKLFSSVLEPNLTELEDLVAFLHSIEKCEILIEARQNQEESKRYLKK